MIKILATSLLASTVAISAWATDSEKPSINDVVVAFYKEPNEACLDAKSALLDSRLHIAQDAINHAAKFIAIEAKFAIEANGKKELEESYADLKNLASNIEEVTVESLDSTCAEALYNLAYYQHQRAEKLYASHKTKRAGQALHAAAANMRHAAKLVDHTFEDNGLQAIDTAEDISGKMIDGEPYSEKRVEGALSNLKAYLRKLNIKIEPPKLDNSME